MLQKECSLFESAFLTSGYILGTKKWLGQPPGLKVSCGLLPPNSEHFDAKQLYRAASSESCVCRHHLHACFEALSKTWRPDAVAASFLKGSGKDKGSAASSDRPDETSAVHKEKVVLDRWPTLPIGASQPARIARSRSQCEILPCTRAVHYWGGTRKPAGAIRSYSVGSKDAVGPTYASNSGWSRLYEAQVGSLTQSPAAPRIALLRL